MRRTHPLVLGVALSTVSATLLAGPTAAAQTSYPGDVGTFGPVFADPAGHECVDAQDTSSKRCKPSAVTTAVMPNGKIVYFDGLEGMNRADLNVVAQFGHTAMSDQARVLDLNGGDPTWEVPTPDDSGTNPGGYDDNAEYLPLVPHDNEKKSNDGNLFCASVVQLRDGRTLITGGTAYYSEPSVPGTNMGVVELEGIRNSRIFDPKDNTFTPSGDMSKGRWYPTTVTLGNGDVFVASGVRKLIKPVYPSAPEESLTNVKQTEIYDVESGQWNLNPASANKSLPLFPRMHLLPNGKVYYDAAGQTFNPAGQSYDEALWNLASVYDPKSQSWEDLGVPQIGGLPLGFRGSGFSVMLPLTPDENGKYSKAEFLSGGGVIGTSPGTYLANGTSTLNTIDLASGDEEFTSKSSGNLNTPRWYGSGLVLPDGKVFLANGASADEVVIPGSAFPVRTTEIWDPETGEWTETAEQAQGRTYHNTASLLPDGRVLLGGHAPIGTGYAQQTDVFHDAFGMSRSTSDPSFQIYKPPYLHWGERPEIKKAPSHVDNNRTMTITVDSPSEISSVRLVRNTTVTHLVDGDQRNVVLDIVERKGNKLTVEVPNSNVVPPGPYMLFANREHAKGEIPSVSKQMMVASGKAPAGQPGTEPQEQEGSTLPAPLNGSEDPVSPLLPESGSDAGSDADSGSEAPSSPAPSEDGGDGGSLLGRLTGEEGAAGAAMFFPLWWLGRRQRERFARR